MTTCGVILAGGQSSRMGRNKALLEMDDQTSIEKIYHELKDIVEEVVIIANEPTLYRFLNVPIYQDRFVDKGPLAGIETAMYHKSEYEQYIIVACDTPLINQDVLTYLLKEIKGYDAVIPSYDGHIHPLSGIYSAHSYQVIRERLQNNQLKIRVLFDEMNTKYIEQFDGFSEEVLANHFFNMNYPEQYHWVIGNNSTQV
ncbi:MAG TPA: molybdenum cofactor guanylyltransferase [Candidatus Avamphibacillus intestinigallinarum]|nr:molybdenum cofactor guanylyltransferase [Candidatus Avamphibacillus intestinigallinarum]